MERLFDAAFVTLPQHNDNFIYMLFPYQSWNDIVLRLEFEKDGAFLGKLLGLSYFVVLFEEETLVLLVLVETTGEESLAEDEGFSGHEVGGQRVDWGRHFRSGLTQDFQKELKARLQLPLLKFELVLIQLALLDLLNLLRTQSLHWHKVQTYFSRVLSELGVVFLFRRGQQFVI